MALTTLAGTTWIIGNKPVPTDILRTRLYVNFTAEINGVSTSFVRIDTRSIPQIEFYITSTGSEKVIVHDWSGTETGWLVTVPFKMTFIDGDSIADPTLISFIEALGEPFVPCSKVSYFGKVLIDLTEDTVTPEVLLAGYTAHNAKGEVIEGEISEMGNAQITYEVVPESPVNVDLNQSFSTDGAQRGFTYDTSYERLRPDNRGYNSSYSYALIPFTSLYDGDVTVMMYQNSEKNYDYGFLSLLDTKLSQSYDATDSNCVDLGGTGGASYGAKGRDGIFSYTYTNVPAGEHFITIKYRKDGSGAAGNDEFSVSRISYPGDAILREKYYVADHSDITEVRWSDQSIPTPTERLAITSNGPYDVTDKAGVDVAVPSPFDFHTATMSMSLANYRAFAYGGGRFVALPYGDTRAYYSSDGLTWYATTVPRSLYFEHVVYGNGIFVAIGNTGQYGVYSSDGVGWSNITMPTSGSWKLTYGNGIFVAVDGNFHSAISTNGYTWTMYTSTLELYCNSITCGLGKFIAPIPDSNKWFGSYDGINWFEMATLSESQSWNRIDFCDNVFILQAAYLPYFLYSIDGGISWRQSDAIPPDDYRNVVYFNGTMVVIGAYSHNALYSIDGKTWTSFTYPAGTGQISFGVAGQGKLLYPSGSNIVYCDAHPSFV